METRQPRWRRIANLGDVNPIEYGGFFVYVDLSGAYAPEGELLETYDDTDDDGAPRWTIYRFSLDRCTFINGILSDNPYHPELPAWFAKPESERADRPQDTTYLSNVATSIGMPESELRDLLCSDRPIDRAQAYRAIGEYHGFENFDSYPRTYQKRSELPRRIRAI